MMSKQYVLVCDEAGMQALANVFIGKSIQFLEVQGMDVGGDRNISALVTPNPPVEQKQVPDAT